MTTILLQNANKVLFCKLFLLPVQAKKANIREERTILAITDFTKSSTNAALYATHLFKDTSLELKLVNVFENPSDKAPLLISVEDILAKDSETGLKKQSEELAEALKNTANISTYGVAGNLKKAIPSISQANSINLIVAGIVPAKKPVTHLENTPLLFMGQSKYPVLLVPENSKPKTLKNILILNLNAQLPAVDKKLEKIFNHDHITSQVIQINEKKQDKATVASIESKISSAKKDIIIFIPSAGDKLDKALLDCQFQELCDIVSNILSY